MDKNLNCNCFCRKEKLTAAEHKLKQDIRAIETKIKRLKKRIEALAAPLSKIRLEMSEMENGIKKLRKDCQHRLLNKNYESNYTTRCLICGELLEVYSPEI